MQSRLLIKELEEAGWTLDRVTGSHHIFTHPYNPYTIPVPHPKKDLPIGTVRRRAGLICLQAGCTGDP
ncbi:type II toxin-antitoxin system HicA family toxin [Pseudomonas fluorescens]|uniref:type II toxin-antitoxin system HicA family toxin n=1 Tax=Pseudomonas fluorescens TaxID=294 RepID=UPI001241B38B|nr:type II toxin-antitoxin system HicA family toxin [Pseudomonas fluorescens]VVN45945.1 hypothetical protein PS639_05747 [Pseudomonas fluorescens]